MTEHYIIGGSAAGSERLDVLAAATWPTSAAECEQTAGELEAFTRTPDSIMSLPRFFQVWGRRV